METPALDRESTVSTLEAPWTAATAGCVICWSTTWGEAFLSLITATNSGTVMLGSSACCSWVAARMPAPNTSRIAIRTTGPERMESRVNQDIAVEFSLTCERCRLVASGEQRGRLRR